MAQPSQADIFAALQAQSSRSRAIPPTTLLSDHTGPKFSLTTQPSGESSKKNKGKIYCFREGCGCVILSPGMGEWVEAEANMIPVEENTPFPTYGNNHGVPAYWHITGSPMSFDNIGFSKHSDLKALPPQAPGNGLGKKVKWLSCADCDLGPVGWSFEGGTEAWLAVERVRYTQAAISDTEALKGLKASSRTT